MNVVPAEQVQDQIVNNEAYILFYQRHKTESIENSGSNSSASDHWLSKIPITSESSSMAMATESEPLTKLNNDAENSKDFVEVLQTSKEIETDVSGAMDIEIPKPLTPDDVKCIDVNNVDDDVDDDECKMDAIEAIDAEIIPIDIKNSNESIDIDITEHMNNDDSINMSPKQLTQPIQIGSSDNDTDDGVELRNATIKKTEASLSMSFPIQRSLWPSENNHQNTIHTYTPILSRGSFNLTDMFSTNLRSEPNVTRPISTSLLQRNSTTDKTKLSNDTVAMVRGINSCSKDTLIFIDSQKRHRSLIDEEKNYMPSQPLWVRFQCFFIMRKKKNKIQFNFLFYLDITGDTA